MHMPRIRVARGGIIKPANGSKRYISSMFSKMQT
jgi:hypothetical protein